MDKTKEFKIMTIRKATLIMFERYLNEFDIEDTNITNLINVGIENIDNLPIDKLSRWLGYIQGYLIFNNKTTVDIERNISRKYFHEAYENENINIPKSIQVYK